MDEINAKIIADLLEDGRKSFADIARECKTTKDVIAKRYKQLEKKGIIVGATIQNSYSCYGCNYVAGIMIFTQPNKAEFVFKELQSLPEAFHVYPVGVNPSITVIVIGTNIDGIDMVCETIKKVPYIEDIDVRLWLNIQNNPHNLSVLQQGAKVGNRNTSKAPKRADIKIDETDKKIFQQLGANPRRPFSKIATELGVTTDTVIKRYEKLKQAGHIKVLIQIDPTKIGYHAFAIFNLSFKTPDTVPSRAETLAALPDVNCVLKTSGRYDHMVSVMLKDLDQLADIQHQIASMPDITKMETTVNRMFGVWPLYKEFIST